MKTTKWPVLKLGGVAAGVAALVAWTSQSALNDEANPPGTALPAGSTNAPVATNTVAADSVPIFKVPPKVPTSPGIAEIVKLAQAGVEQDVLLAYVENSQVAYDPTADELVYLHDVGIPPKVVTALIQQGNRLRDQAAKSALAAANNLTPPSPNVATPPTIPLENPALSTQPPSPVNSAGATSPGYPLESPSYTVPAPAAPPVSAPLPEQVNYFYDSLTPYGTWYQMPDYGWCWQPSVAVVQPAWRPYCDYGRWLDSDCGWYWQSDYSWGWAPFHYGRWFHHAPAGWLWVPDTVWGPSWVSWRRSPAYCGWAPLPPAAAFGVGGGFSYFGASVGVGFGFGLTAFDFTFVPVRHFCDWNPAPFCLSPVLAGNIFHQTVIVNNYIQGPNNQIINLGVDRSTIATAMRSEITKVTIRDLPPAAGKRIKPDRVERDGSRLVVYRPQPQQGLPGKPSVQLAYRRQELPLQPAAVGSPSTHGVRPPALRPAVVSPPTRVPVESITKRTESPPAPGPTATVAKNEFNPVIERSVTGFTSDESRVVQSPPPLLGRYLTQPSIARPTGQSYQPRADAIAPPSWPRNEMVASTRQEAVRTAPVGTQFGPRGTLPQTEKTISVRPSFYNPPNTAVQPATVRPPSLPYEDSAATPPRFQSLAARPAVRPPAAVPSPTYRGPIYAAPPAYTPRPAYVPPSQAQYSTPEVRSYQPVRPQPGYGGSVSRPPSYSPAPNPGSGSGPARRGNTY